MYSINTLLSPDKLTQCRREKAKIFELVMRVFVCATSMNWHSNIVKSLASHCFRRHFN